MNQGMCVLLTSLCSGYNYTDMFTLAGHLTLLLFATLFLTIFLELPKVKLLIFLIKVHITCTGSLESTYTSFSNDSSLSSFLTMSPLISG